MLVNGITLEWLIKVISHMAGAELLEQIIIASLMDNGKMVQKMDTLDLSFNLVIAISQNDKMVRK